MKPPRKKTGPENRRSQLTTSSWLVAGGRNHEIGEPLNVPIVPASNFLLGGDLAYARDEGTPTWWALEELVGGLEGGMALAFASGMAAVAAVLDPLPVGARLLLPEGCYQGVAGLAAAGEKAGRFQIERIAVADTAAWLESMPSADLIWLESPSNPLLEVADLVTICAGERKPGSILAVDNTFATPLNQQPLDLGADVSIQSASKFIGGHSDLLSGVVTTRSESLWQQLDHTRLLTGATPGVLECYLAVRGARTMALRVERAQQTAGVLAERLEAHGAVEWVRYPGLTSHPTHQVAKQQLEGFGSIISFDVAGGAEAADRVCRAVELIQHATSLGAVESTMERRALIPGQEHLPPGLLRLSVGIEDLEDLWRDLEQALG
jgi:cystathionine gamma-synthase